MKKGPAVQGTLSKLFGKKHASPGSASLYATNPPWIFTQEAPDEGARDFDGICYGDARFDTISESGTATLKARPRVRPLLTFLPLNAQENHGLAVPTPSVPEDFAGKDVADGSSLVNGSLRLYSSVGDLRLQHYGLDPLIPPPPPGPAPGPPQDLPQAPGESPPPPPPSTAPPPPPLLLEPPPPPPPPMAPPPPPTLDVLSPPPTPGLPDFIPPVPPLASLAPPPPSVPAPPPLAPVSPYTEGTRLFPPGGGTKWTSEVALNGRQPETPRSSPPRSPAQPKGPHPETNLTAPRLSKVPPPAPVRTSSISLQEAQGAPPEEEGAIKKAPSHLPLPPSFHIRPASQVYPDRATEQDHSREPRAGAPPSPRPSQAEPPTNELAGPLPPAPLPPPPAPPLPPPAPPLPPPRPSAVQAAPPAAEFPKHPKSSLPALKPTPKSKPKLPTPVPEGPSEPADWRDPDQLEQLRSQLAAYFCGPRREDRALGRRPGPTVAAQDKEGKKGLNPPGEVAPQRLPEKRTPEKTPEKTPSGVPEKGPSLPLPPVDYDPQDAPTPSVQQIRKELEARLSASVEKDARPSVGSLPPKPQPGGGPSLANGTDNGRFPKPVAKDLPPLSTTPQPTALLRTTAAPGPATPSTATIKPATPSHLTAEKGWVPAGRGGQQEHPEPREGIVPSQPGPQTHPTGPTGPPTPKVSPGREEMRLFYKPHSHRSSPSPEAATETPTLARGEATGPGGPVGARGPQAGPATPPALSPPSDQPLRHPVTGEVVEHGSPMALLLAARQRAQKGRPGGLALGRSLPGSLRGHGGLLESRSNGVFPMDCKPNSFTVVPKEADKVTLLASERKSPGSAEPSSLPRWPAMQPHGPRGTWDRPVPSSLPQDPLLPRSLSSPPSPFCRQQDEEEEFTFEVIPPPPEFSNDPVPSAPKDLGRPLALAFPRALAFPHVPERGSPGGRSLIKKRLYVGEPPRAPGPGRSQGAPSGPTSRRLPSAAAVHGRRMSLEGSVARGTGDTKYRAPGDTAGEHCLPPAMGRSYINTFTVRPGTRHPISYAYPRAHRKAMS